MKNFHVGMLVYDDVWALRAAEVLLPAIIVEMGVWCFSNPRGNERMRVLEGDEYKWVWIDDYSILDEES